MIFRISSKSTIPNNSPLESITGKMFREERDTTFTKSPKVASTDTVFKSVSMTLSSFINVKTALSLLWVIKSPFIAKRLA